MNIYNPDAWSFPIPGRTGWRDRGAEGPLWVLELRDRPWRRRIPYCLFVGGPVAGAPQTCRQTPGYPCCRATIARTRAMRQWGDC